MRRTIKAGFMRVRIEVPAGESAGQLMSDMRIWLDHQGIQPTDFKALTAPFGGGIAFDVEFRDRGQAALFQAAFPQ